MMMGYFLSLLLFLTITRASDVFSPFYGTFQASSADVQTCINLCNSCCIVTANITKQEPNVFVDATMTFDSSSLSRCKATSLFYSASLNYVTTTSGTVKSQGQINPITGMPGIEMDFNSSPQASVFIFNQGCQTPMYLTNPSSTSNANQSSSNWLLYLFDLALYVVIVY